MPEYLVVLRFAVLTFQAAVVGWILTLEDADVSAI